MGNTTVQSTIPPNAPPWLDEAYTNALDAVRATIWHFAKVSCDDPLVKVRIRRPPLSLLMCDAVC